MTDRGAAAKAGGTGDVSATEVADRLRERLGEGDLACLLCDHGAARPVPETGGVRFGPATFAGVAKTVRAPGGALAAVRRAVREPCDGHVLLLHSSGEPAVWGGRLNAAARTAGAAGVVVVGRVRDVPTLRASSLGIVASGVAPHRSDADDPGEVDVALHVGRTHVNPGDVLLADENGVVAIAPSAFAMVVRQLDDWIREERAADEAGPSGTEGNAR
ncbi:MAG: hypothetical protein U5K81_14185 [Trueperaceae bacterium]|nr:hypothetical protein [Trueperaceae bacterium]